MDFKLGIVVNCSTLVGLGHVRRCLSIAEQFECKEAVCFIVPNAESVKELEGKGYRIYQYDDQECLKELVLQIQCQVILIDIKEKVQEVINLFQTHSSIVLLEDLYEQTYTGIDALINYNIYAQKLGYETAYSKDVDRLIGECYAPIKISLIKQKEISDIKASVSNKAIETILITTGSTDINELNLQIIRPLLDQPFKLKIWVGIFDKTVEELERLAKQYENIELIYGNQEISLITQQVDLVISAAGFTLYELAYLGIPTIIVSHGIRHLVGSEFEQKVGFGYAGNRHTFSEENLKACINQLACNDRQRLEINNQGPKVIDGKGAMRIRQFLEKMSIDKVLEEDR